MRDLTLPQINVPLRIEEEAIGSPIPFWQSRDFWLIAGGIVLSIAYNWWLHKSKK